MASADHRVLALLGDSILDNADYARPGPDTTTHLRALMGTGWTVERTARDGAVMDDIASQFTALDARRPDVTVLSVGGNDAFGHIGILTPRQTTSTEFLGSLMDIADDFAGRYAKILEFLRPRTARLVACTIYEVPLSDPRTARLARAPLGLLNDGIVRAARRVRAEVLELRDVCTETADYVLQVEPSARGARRIAEAIAAAVNSIGLT